MIIPYIVPLFLGMSYDARYSTPGVDIFDKQWIDEPEITTKGSVSSTYTISSKLSENYKNLDISGDIALKVKTGLLNIEGKGSYIKNEVNNTNRIEVLTMMKYESKTLSLKHGKTPLNDWFNKFSADVLGTHYVSEVTYGAELIASARFVALKSEYMTNITAEVKGAFQGSDTEDANKADAGGKIEQLANKLAGKANLEISFYGTVPLMGVPNSVQGLQELLKNFKQHITEAGLTDGVPIKVKLEPLTVLIPDDETKKKFQYIKNQALESQLNLFEEKFDDLRTSRLEILTWAKSLPHNLSPEVEAKIGGLMKTITTVLDVFYETVWKMDQEKGPEQLKVAFDAYDPNKALTDVYFWKTRTLKRDVEPLIDWDDAASDTYIQWGNDNCTGGDHTQVLYKGFVMSSQDEAVGGMAPYACASATLQKAYAVTQGGGQSGSYVSGIRYTKLDKSTVNPFKGPNAKKISEQGIPCAHCYAPRSASVAMFPALSHCPSTWEQMYSGFLMSAQIRRGATTEYICVDDTPSEPYPMEAQQLSLDTAALTVVRSDGSLPADKYPNGALVPCVVCSIPSSQVIF